MGKVKISKDDLVKQLRETLERIDKFCKIYDEGDVSIAKDIAVKLRILFHNTNLSKSLLRQLKLEHIQFVDSAGKYDPKNLIAHHGLLSLSFKGSDVKLTPLLKSSSLNLVPIKNWWDSKKVIVDRKKNIFTRKDVILEPANTDGGAHVDSEINQNYYDVSRANSLGWIYKNDATGEERPLNDPIPPCIRQIAYEVLETFKRIDIEKESKLK